MKDKNANALAFKIMVAGPEDLLAWYESTTFLAPSDLYPSFQIVNFDTPNASPCIELFCCGWQQFHQLSSGFGIDGTKVLRCMVDVMATNQNATSQELLQSLYRGH